MLAAKPSRQSSAVWQGSTKDGYTLRLTRSALTRVISQLKQTGLEHLVKSNNKGNLEAAVVVSIAQVVNHANASGIVSSREFGRNLRAFTAIGKTRQYQILTQPIDRKQSVIIFVRSTPIQKVENEYENEYEGEYENEYEGEYESEYEGEYEGEYMDSPSHGRRGNRGGASSTRGGASSTRGGASSTRGGASSTRGGASSTRGGASSTRGGARQRSSPASTSRSSSLQQQGRGSHALLQRQKVPQYQQQVDIQTRQRVADRLANSHIDFTGPRVEAHMRKEDRSAGINKVQAKSILRGASPDEISSGRNGSYKIKYGSQDGSKRNIAFREGNRGIEVFHIGRGGY
jgi:hypothetical protein